MKIPVYKSGMPAGHKEVPDSIMRMASDLSRWMEMNDCTQACGIGPVHDLQRQLAEVTRERDALQAALKLADALVNRERRFDYTVGGRDVTYNCGPSVEVRSSMTVRTNQYGEQYVDHDVVEERRLELSGYTKVGNGTYKKELP